MTRELHILTGQIINVPRLRIQSMIGGIGCRIGHVPRFEASELGAATNERLLVASRLIFAYANREHVRLGHFVLIEAGYELKASEIARKRSANRSGANAAYGRAINLIAVERREEIDVRVDFLSFALFQMLATSNGRANERNGLFKSRLRERSWLLLKWLV